MQKLTFKNLDGLIVTTPVNIRYFTGFTGVAPDEREAYLLLTSKKAFLFTNALYLQQAHLLVSSNPQLTVVEVSREQPFGKKLKEIVQTLGNISKLGFEEENLTYAEHQKIKQELEIVELIATRNKIEELRMIKRPDEIENINKACALTDECYSFIMGKLKPGVTEGEIAWEIESFFKKRGAGIAFSPIVAFGANSSQPHYAPGSDLKNPQGQTLKHTDIVLLDFGCTVNGYCFDITRVVFMGEPRDEWIRAYETVLTAQETALHYFTVLKSGQSASGKKADDAARKVIARSGFPTYPHSLGHNLGLAIHEEPRLNVKKDSLLKPGMVFTIEPGIYVEGQYGIRIEDVVLLKEDGIEILTKSGKQIKIIS